VRFFDASFLLPEHRWSPPLLVTGTIRFNFSSAKSMWIFSGRNPDAQDLTGPRTGALDASRRG